MMATKRPAPVIEKQLAELREQLAGIEQASQSPESGKSKDPSKPVQDKKLTEAKIAELEAELKSLGDPAP